MTDQSDTGDPTAWLDTATVELTVKTLLVSHLATVATGELNSPANYSVVRVDCRAPVPDMWR
eukprot:899510-Prorocentrum_minimum.AAC.1